MNHHVTVSTRVQQFISASDEIFKCTYTVTALLENSLSVFNGLLFTLDK